jgi:hypothetical protein
MLIPAESAARFLVQYKTLMQQLNEGIEPDSMVRYAELRTLIYHYRDTAFDALKPVLSPEFVSALTSAVFGQFIYLKKYQKGYVFKDVNTGIFYQVKALTTLLEEHLTEFMIVETALLPFDNEWLCDGLLLHGAVLDKNEGRDARDAYAEAKKLKQVIA